MNRTDECDNRTNVTEQQLDRWAKPDITEKGQLIPTENRSEKCALLDWIKRAALPERQTNCNKPIETEQQGAVATGVESMSEPSQIANLKPDPVPNPLLQKNQTDFTRMAVTPQDQTSSHMSQNDDSYFIPSQMSIVPPRMIQQGQQGRAINMNAFRRLKNMSNAGEPPDKLPALPPPGDLGTYGYPTTKAEEKPKKGYPGTKEYQATRIFCCWTTFLIAIVICCALVTAAVAILKTKDKCTAVSATLIVSDILAIVIAVIEWIRLWLWREPLAIRQKPSLRYAAKANAPSMGPNQGTANLPAITSEPSPLPNVTYAPITNNDGSAGGFLTYGFQQRLYDVPQFITAIFLILLYFAGAFCVFCTIAASAAKMNECGILSTSGLGFSAVLAIFILLRLMLCCMSDVCQGIFLKTAQTGGMDPVPMVAVNQLHQTLPGLGKQTSKGAQPTAWLMNLANASDPRQQLSICQPMPAKFSQDFTQ